MPEPPPSSTSSGALSRLLIGRMLWVFLFAAISGVARVVQDATIAWRYGTTALVDAFYWMLGVANWPVAVALSMATVLLAPVEARLRQADRATASHFRGELLATTLIVAALAWPLAGLALQALAGVTWGQGGDGLQEVVGHGAWALAPGVSLGLVGALCAAWLVAAERQALTLFEALPPMVLVVLLWSVPGPVLFWGTTLGMAVQVLVMVWWLRRAGAMPEPRLGLSASAWNGFLQGALLLCVSQALFASLPLLDPVWAEGLGEGAVATLSYANRLVLGLQGLAAVALQRAALPLLATGMATDLVRTRQLALRWTLAAAVLGLLLGGVVTVLADPLVSMLYERGRFSAADRNAVATLLGWGMLQMPVFLAGTVLVASLASASARRAMAGVALAGVASKLLLNLLLASPLGAVGLMVATAGMYATTAGVAAWCLWRLCDGSNCDSV